MGTKLEAKTSIKLTNESVKALPLAGAGKHYVYDTERRGFCVRVTPTGKFYAVRLKVKGKEYQRSICRVEETTAVAARGKAEVIIGELRQGVDRTQIRRDENKALKEAMFVGSLEGAKQAEKLMEQADALKRQAEALNLFAESAPPIKAKRAKAAAATLNLAAAHSVAFAADPSEKPTIFTRLLGYLREAQLKPRTICDYYALANVELKAWAEKPLCEIDRTAADDMFKEIKRERGESRAVHAMRLCRILCKKEGVGLQVWDKFFPKPVAKKTPLRPADGQIIYNELQGLQHTLAASKYVFALLLTGCRREELADVLVRDVGRDCRTLTIYDPKNGNDHVIQCSAQLRGILKTLVVDRDGDPRQPDAALFGLCGDPRKTLAHIKRAVQLAADVATDANGTAVLNKDFSLHHLRKLAGKTLNHLRFPHATIQAVLNHTPDSDDVTTVNYIGDVDEEDKRLAWQALADYYSVSKGNLIQLPTAMAA